jgi:serine/threonine protein kinase
MNRSPDNEDDDRDDYEVGSDPELNAAPPSTSDEEEVLEVNGYRLVRELTRGGQAAVFLAIQKSTGRKVALKLMFGGPFASAVERQRMDQEVHILAALDHPNIISVIDRGETPDGSHYFVMNYVEGRALNEFVDDYHRDHGGPEQLTDLGDLLRVFKRLCEAVNAAHLRGIVHRDLKPANIIIDTYGEPHILDFGLAHAALAQGGSPEKSPTRTGEFVGSLEWASPEQASGEASKIDTRTDVYALGVILYEILTGEFPYEVFGELREVLDHIVTTRPVAPSAILQAARQKTRGARSALPLPVDARLDAMVLKALAKTREERYQTAGELARDLGQYLEGKRPAAAPAALNLRRLALMALPGALAIAGVAFWALDRFQPATEQAAVAYEEGVYGYTVVGSKVHFVFEPSRYEMARHEDGRLIRLDQVGTLDRINVVGAFNAWVHEDRSWMMKRVGPDRFELRKPLAEFSGRSEWPFKFLINGNLWVGAPATAANREVVVTDTATFNLLLMNPEVELETEAEKLRDYRALIHTTWLGQGANLAMDEKQLYHFTFTHLPPGMRVTDLETLRGIPLTSLDLGEAKVTDLSPLRDMTTLNRLYVSDGTFQTLTTDLMAGLRRYDFEAAEKAAHALFPDLTATPALASARNLIMDSVQNLRAAREQPKPALPHTATFRGHRYAFIVYPMSWSDARTFSEAVGGHLASVTSLEENTWIAQSFGVACLGRSLWLGGTDEGTESFWRWQNGEGWRFEHWNAPEPNNNGGVENVLAVKPDGWWIDANGTTLNLPFVVEWDK